MLMLQGALENLASPVILYMRRLRSKEERAGLGFLLSAMAERNEDNCLGKCCRLGIGGLVNILSESSFFFAYLVLHYLAPPYSFFSFSHLTIPQIENALSHFRASALHSASAETRALRPAVRRGTEGWPCSEGVL